MDVLLAAKSVAWRAGESVAYLVVQSVVQKDVEKVAK
jgi:hypothetical protein